MDITMKFVRSLTLISLVGIVLGAPTSNDEDKKLVITKSMFPEKLVQYTGEHEIVNILLPINGLNIHEDDSSGFDSNSDESDLEIILFFVEADIDSDGNRIDQGLYVLKQGNATKILEHGRDAAASSDESKLVFFGAADGIYVYNQENNSADKYGTVDDSIIGIAKEDTGDVIYILTENHELFKVSNNGTTKEKIDEVVNAKQMIVDYSNNIYFYSDDKQVYVRTTNGVKKIEGIPENPNSVLLIKPPFLLDDGVLLLVDNVDYTIYANGTSINSGIEFKPNAKPSAFSVEAFMTQYYAYEKKLYEVNVLAILFGEVLEELRTFVTTKTKDIGPVSNKARIHRHRA